MADDALSEAWEKAAKDITKGKNEGALQTLRAADPQAIDPMTARLVGEATWNIAKANDSKSDYRKAAMFLREATKKNPKDKKTSSLYNKLLNEMQEKRISETVIPRMFNNGGPTPAGIFVIFAVFLLALGVITIANTESTTTDYIELNLSWTENGVTETGIVSLELYPNDAPAHAENFKQLVVQGKYDGTKFHRVIDDFMIQGGDFTNGDGTGGHAVIWDGYCNGEAKSASTDCAETLWTLGEGRQWISSRSLCYLHGKDKLSTYRGKPILPTARRRPRHSIGPARYAVVGWKAHCLWKDYIRL